MNKIAICNELSKCQAWSCNCWPDRKTVVDAVGTVWCDVVRIYARPGENVYIYTSTRKAAQAIKDLLNPEDSKITIIDDALFQLWIWWD